ncbi:MAG: hypothetical protein M3176_02690 [Chloroflexota bacterium]|nr:hypothetical protein [Chloroflexota bacterium]
MLHGSRTIYNGGDTLMRRLTTAFLASLGVCLVASFIIAIVAHINGGSWLIYPLGALVVVPIPVMLVLLFFLIRRGLRDEEAGNPVGTGGKIEVAVVAAVARSFPVPERAEALAILSAYGVGPDEPEHTRVRIAIIHLSDGNLDRLQYFTDQAKEGYRDVLVWDAEIAIPDRK